MIKKTILGLLSFFVTFIVKAETLPCVAYNVLDGITFNCSMLNGKTIKVRLSQVSPQLLTQRNNDQAKNYLNSLLNDSGKETLKTKSKNEFWTERTSVVNVDIVNKDALYHYANVQVSRFNTQCIYKMKKDMELNCATEDINVNQNVRNKLKN